MSPDLIERKLTIFISSRINEHYSIVRKALKTMLLQTGMVASVYVFESDGARSENVQKAYLSEVSKSDLCIFLIDNSDGVPDAVFKEHLRAKRDGIHRLYFFCDENERTPTPLQNELMKTGETKYYVVRDFSDFPKEVYRSVIQDIIDLYRGAKFSEINETKESKAENVSYYNNLVLRKDIFKQYTRESLLVRVLNPYDFETISETLNTNNDTFNELCANFLSTVIGRNVFNLDKFFQLRDCILLKHEDFIKSIIEMRLNAIADYFKNNLEDCYREIQKAYEIATETPNVPTWLLNDILVDMRNISNIIDIKNNRIQIQSEAQIKLDDSPEIVYYPLLDRFDSIQKSELLDDYFEKITQSPYTQRFGTLTSFNYVASCFNIAIRFGSLTQILNASIRYGDTLITKFIETEDYKLFFEIVRIFVITQQEKKLNHFVSAYNKNVSAVTTAEIETLIKSIKTIPLDHNKFLSYLLLLETFGYYLSEEQFSKLTDLFFYNALNWCEDEKRNVNIGYYILKAVKKNLRRINNQKIAELIVAFFDHSLRLFYFEILDILVYLDFKQIRETEQNKILNYCIIFIKEKDFPYFDALKNVIISIRKNINKNTDLLDRAVKENLPNFYFKEYDLETNKYNLLRHIDNYIKEIHERNQSANGSVIVGYVYNPCYIIKKIVEIYDVNLELEVNYIEKIVLAIEETLVNKAQQADQKISAIELAIFLYNRYPHYSLWDDFKTKILVNNPDILSGATVDLIFFSNNNQNILKLNYLLMQISFAVHSFEEITLGFAEVMSYSNYNFIYAVRSVCNFLNCIDITKIDKSVLSIIAHFILSIGKEEHKDAQLYAIDSLILLTKSDLYSTVIWERLAYMMDDAISDIKLRILRGIRDLESDRGIKNFILQKGRTDNHYLVRKLAEDITASVTKDF